MTTQTIGRTGAMVVATLALLAAVILIVPASAQVVVALLSLPVASMLLASVTSRG